jgi:DNA topoisomerase-6 subunit B
LASIAEQLAKKQKEISISEFFERNKHILGFDSLQKALLTSVKEGVDNSLDACEDAGILPEIIVSIKRLSKDEFTVSIEDNGPGIVKKELPQVFGRLLYGSRFHAIKQSRGQQGIGISGVVMYAQITMGKATKIRSKVKENDVAYEVELMMDTKKNRPIKAKEDFVIWDKEHGTRAVADIKGRYVSSKQSVFEYLKSSAIVNPHATIIFKDPEGKKTIFERVTEEMPKPATEIKPHPYGIELGTLLKMAKYTKSYKFGAFLQTDFSRISDRVAKEICRLAEVDFKKKPKSITLDEAKRALDAIEKVKIMAPPSDCLSPIQARLVKKGLKNVLGNLKPEFYCPPITREPKVYRGNPFAVEVGIVYGGELPSDQPVQILRYANRVPLLFQQGACAITAGIESVDWRRYGLDQRGGRGIPIGPAVIIVHVASTKVPFTSESKEAIANISEIVEEIKLALQLCARSLKTHLNKKVKKSKTREKFDIVQKILPQIAKKSSSIVHKPIPSLEGTITKIMNIVWIDDSITYEKKKKLHKAKIEIYNYTPTGKRISLHTVLPKDYLESTEPKPKEVRDDGKVTWSLGSIKSTEKTEVVFELHGLDEDEYDEVELYVSRINPVLVVGAEPLPGDWELDYREKYEGKVEVHEPKVEEEAKPDKKGKPGTQEGPDEEVDYDEVQEVLEDEEGNQKATEGVED